MSVYCGNCGKLIHVSNFNDWTTNKEDPELSCMDGCGVLAK